MIDAIDCNKGTDIRIDLKYEAVRLVTGVIRGVASQILVCLHSCGKALALIDVKSHKALLTFTHLMGLLLKRKKKVLFQSHIEKRTDLGNFLDLKDSRLTESHLRF